MELTVKQVAIIKRVAQSVAPYTVKKAKLQDQILRAAEQIKELNNQMEAFQAPIRTMTGGLTTEDLIIRTTVNGAAKYEPNPDVLRWDEKDRVYKYIDVLAEEQKREVTEQEEEAITGAMEEEALNEPEDINPFED